MRAVGHAAAAPRPAPRPRARGALRDRRRPAREGRRPDGQERHRLRPARGCSSVRSARSACCVQVTLRCRPRPARRALVPRPPDAAATASAPSALLWDGDHDVRAARGRRGRRRRAGARVCTRLDGRRRCPTGAHRGRISVAPGDAGRASRRALDAIPGARWCAELGVGTVHVAGRRRRRRSPRARAVAHAHDGWLLREAGGAGDRRLRPRRSRTPTLMRRIKDAFDPTGKLAPGPAPAVSRARGGPLHLDADELVVVRVVRALPAALPDLPRHRPRDRVAARPHRGDARSSSSRAAPIDDAFARAMDECVQCRGLRGRVPVVGAVRPPHGDDPRRAARPRRLARRGRRAARVDRLPARAPAPLAAARGHLGARGSRSGCASCPRRFGLPRLSARSLATPLDAPRRRRPDRVAASPAA